MTLEEMIEDMKKEKGSQDDGQSSSLAEHSPSVEK